MGLREQIKEIIAIIEENNVNEVEVSTWWGRKIRVAKHSVGSPGVVTAAGSPQIATEAAPLEIAAPSDDTPAPKGEAVVSPIVGTFYLSPGPDAEPFIKVGDSVKVGQIICIVEAMKIMNEIESDVAGVVLEILPTNAGPVEFNQPLIMVDPA